MFISKMMSVKKTLLVVVAFGCLIEQSVVAVRTRSCDITLRSGKKVMHAPTVKERVKREHADQRHGQAAQALAQVQVASMATPMVVAEADDDGAGAAQAVVCDACARDGHPLHCAAKTGHADCVRALLFAGADVNAQDVFGITPLHCAAKTGHADCVRVLLLHGAAIGARDSCGWTPLHWATREGDVECVQVLLTAGADWRLTDIDDQTAADVACVCYRGADRDQRIKQIRDLIRSAPARTSLQVLCALAAARHQVQLQENEVMPQEIKDFLKQLGWYDGQTGGGAGSSSK